MKLAGYVIIAGGLVAGCSGSDPSSQAPAAPVLGTTSVEFPVLEGVQRTPEESFVDLPGYSFEEHYVELGNVRMHYVDEGPRDGRPVLMLHGEPTWSYLYRKMIPVVAAAGHRVVVPDLIGFGMSDKPANESDHTYQRHVDWVLGLIEILDLREMTLVLQDWGGIIGLRLAAENADRVHLMVVSNTMFVAPKVPEDEAIISVIPNTVRALVENVPISAMVQGGTVREHPQEVIEAYDAPFPESANDPFAFKAGPLALPLLVPASVDAPGAEAARAAERRLFEWQKPVLSAFSDGDPFLGGLHTYFEENIPGARDQPHTTIPDAGHFVQEDNGEALAAAVVSFMALHPSPDSAVEP